MLVDDFVQPWPFSFSPDAPMGLDPITAIEIAPNGVAGEVQRRKNPQTET